MSLKTDCVWLGKWVEDGWIERKMKTGPTDQTQCRLQAVLSHSQSQLFVKKRWESFDRFSFSLSTTYVLFHSRYPSSPKSKRVISKSIHKKENDFDKHTCTRERERVREREKEREREEEEGKSGWRLKFFFIFQLPATVKPHPTIHLPFSVSLSLTNIRNKTTV
jgi:hypothetical protein